jgi:hypothetical protein
MFAEQVDLAELVGHGDRSLIHHTPFSSTDPTASIMCAPRAGRINHTGEPGWALLSRKNEAGLPRLS